MKHLIAPSILAADFGNLERDFKMINNSQADWFHVDIMDGVFVPNISFGFPIMNTLKKHATKLLDVHLMLVDPDRYIKDFKEGGAGMLTVHYEACTHLHRTVQAIKAEGMMAGVALNPHTPVSVLESIITDLDMVLIMSVNPGFGGQKFIENAYEKVSQTRAIANEKNSGLKIQVDGGVTSANAGKLIQCGADVLVAGSFVFKSDNPTETIQELKNIEPVLQ